MPDPPLCPVAPIPAQSRKRGSVVQDWSKRGPGVTWLLRLFALAGALFLAFLFVLALLGASEEDPPPLPTVGAVTVTVPDRAEEQRLVNERESWRRTAVKRGRTIRKTRAAMQRLIRGGVYAHPLESAFLCIHAHEGAWDDPHAPYWGGLQMDLDFQRAHGRDFLNYFGTADRWPASVQIAVAIRAYMHRGFGPWPTRRFCGL